MWYFTQTHLIKIWPTLVGMLSISDLPCNLNLIIIEKECNVQESILFQIFSLIIWVSKFIMGELFLLFAAIQIIRTLIMIDLQATQIFLCRTLHQYLTMRPI